MTCKNFVELIGVVGNVQSAEIGGKKVIRMTVATNRAYRDREGCPVITTTWFNVRFWETEKSPMPEDIGKCDKVHVEGRLEVMKYVNADGIDQSCFEVVATKLEKLELNENLQMEE